jgi:hypothetical protein
MECVSGIRLDHRWPDEDNVKPERSHENDARCVEFARGCNMSGMVSLSIKKGNLLSKK